MANITGWDPADYGLKPCPFCGNGPTEIVIDQRHTSIYSSDMKIAYSRIRCSFCNLTVEEDAGRRDAKEIWNRRAGEYLTVEEDAGRRDAKEIWNRRAGE